MSTSEDIQRLSHAIVAFAVEGRFPEDIAELPPVTGERLQPAIDDLAKARQKLEDEIHVINEETKEDVSSWVRNSKTLQEDIIRSKTMASDIVRQSEAPEVSGEAIQDAEDKIEFLNREVQYSQQLHSVLSGLRRANQLLNQVEQARDEQRILDSLKLLEQAWAALDQVGVSKSNRAMRLLDIRSFELKSAVHEVFDQLWKSLVDFDIDGHKIAVHRQAKGGTMTLSDAVLGLQAYKEVDERMEQFWRNLDTVIVSPRMTPKQPKYPRIVADGDKLQLIGTANSSVEALMVDLTTMFTFLSSKLPKELLRTLTGLMMGEIIPRLTNDWLNSEVPSSLQNMKHFQRLIQHTKQFCLMLKKNGYSEFDDLVNWVNKAPINWLGKCRDVALDNVRERLTSGIGASRAVERVEKHTVSITEGRELTTTTGAGAAADKADWGEDWGDNWDDDAEEQNEASIPQAVASNLRSKPASRPSKPAAQPTTPKDEGDEWGWGDEVDQNDANHDNDDGGEEWGWGDEDNEPLSSPIVQPPPPPKPVARPVRTQVASPVRRVTPSFSPQSSPRPAKRPMTKATPSPSPMAANKPTTRPPVKASPSTAKASAAPKQRQEQTRELVLRETYHISSMPDPVLQLIFNILEDAASLTREDGEYELVAGTAPGLFGLPTFALALFRSISPYYYSLGDGGNMFLYNDAMYLAEKLTEFSARWKERSDLTAKAKTMLRLDSDVKTLQSFANRSYAAEMGTQKTILQDMLGGPQGISDDVKAAVEAGTSRIQVVAATWEPILARSVWTQAVGSLTDSLATHLITEVLEMSSIGQDEAYNIADAISSAEELDKFFLPSNLLPPEQRKQQPHDADEIPLTDRYAPNWLRLKYLSQVLQSNLVDVKYLWCEGQLSLYFSATEVVDLVHASFEDNPKTRETVRDIEAKPALSSY